MDIIMDMSSWRVNIFFAEQFQLNAEIHAKNGYVRGKLETLQKMSSVDDL